MAIADRSDETRNMSTAERSKRFRAWKEKEQAADAVALIDATHWHVVDEEMLPSQYADIPPALCGDTHTSLLAMQIF